MLPLVGYAGIVPQVVGLWHQIAKQLTDWENHRKWIFRDVLSRFFANLDTVATRVGHTRAQTLKMFALNALVSYGVLTLTAYVYRE